MLKQRKMLKYNALINLENTC